MAHSQLHLPPAEVLRSDPRAQTAKAHVRKSDPQAMGKVITAVREASRLNLDEFAREVGRDPRLIKRWESGEDRPQIEAVFAVPAFQPLVLEAMAQQIPQVVTVKTVIEIARTA